MVILPSSPPIRVPSYPLTREERAQIVRATGYSSNQMWRLFVAVDPVAVRRPTLIQAQRIAVALGLSLDTLWERLASRWERATAEEGAP